MKHLKEKCLKQLTSTYHARKSKEKSAFEDVVLPTVQTLHTLGTDIMNNGKVVDKVVVPTANKKHESVYNEVFMILPSRKINKVTNYAYRAKKLESLHHTWMDIGGLFQTGWASQGMDTQ